MEKYKWCTNSTAHLSMAHLAPATPLHHHPPFYTKTPNLSSPSRGISSLTTHPPPQLCTPPPLP